MAGIVKGVLQVTITIAAGATSGTATISSTDMTLSELKLCGVRGAHTGYTPSTDTASIVKTSSTVITASRNSSDASNALVVDATLTTFPSSVVKSVQDVVVAISNTSASATISAVTLANSVLYYNGSITNNTNTLYFSPDLVLANTTTVTANIEAGAFTTNAYGSVLELNTGVLNSSTQQGTVVMGTGDATKTATITAVTAANTMLLCGGALLGSTTGNSDFWPRMTLTSGTVVTTTRTTTGTAETMSFSVGELKAADVKSVNRGDIIIASSGSTNTATITSVNTALCAVEFQGNTSGASAAETTANACATVALTNPTTMTVARVGTPAISLAVSYEAFEYIQNYSSGGFFMLMDV